MFLGRASKRKSDPAQPGPLFHPIGDMETCAECPPEKVAENVRASRKRGLPSFWDMPGLGKYKGDAPIALVAGGPSLNRTLNELAKIETVMTCGTVHDHLIECGRIPQYAVLCDPNPLCVEWVKNPQRETTYLVSSSCDPSMFDHLAGYNVVIWHCAGTDNSMFGGERAVGGGCTVTLRAMNLAILLGHLYLDYFGMDSAFPAVGPHHAYPLMGPNGLDMETQKRCIVRVGGRLGKLFLTTPAWIAQAAHFQEMLKNYGHMFVPTVHGDGMIAEIMRLGRVEAMRSRSSDVAASYQPVQAQA